ncbi:outer membrane protein OmpK [Stutzerimonas kirkiae]|uniref:Nucleoside-specific outer membrane channel protein Tsx n=1 Tax=Stutzerimonas kirkiae TaxID=2211392 RepID=A0A4Q9RCI2_9GAMM|nr:outer membrane protein OmpK [Stutzerimonas kirkiae]TBU98063.1 hypothetical protein DNJ96_06435 [Stutzerimonas kirkiae]TBV02916.1 hypothetical protein DNJ95_08105 [Stutzerimonas kirkiae]TBV11114.1 hypothetical protein DNK08_04055 [Stutzerimonas kirkiae]TBV13018.1 hypothetical protein DNK01_12770 [Stutzerimonas kirkiae]
MKRTLPCFTLATGLLFSGYGMADSPLLWHGNSLTYLNGTDFQVDGGQKGKTQQTVTFEHVSGWRWGDLFMFVDHKWFNGLSGSEGRTYYGEFSPRLSLGKVTGKSFAFGPVKDVLISATYERGKDGNQSYLLGPAVDLNVPGFDRLAINTYYRKPDGTYGNKPSGQWQITPTWAMTIPVGKSDILFDGYIDWVVNDAGSKNKTGNYMNRNLHFNPQIKYDLGKALNYGAKKLYVGVEYSYWENKYGIEDRSGFDTNQNSTSLLIKAHF